MCLLDLVGEAGAVKYGTVQPLLGVFATAGCCEQQEPANNTASEAPLGTECQYSPAETTFSHSFWFTALTMDTGRPATCSKLPPGRGTKMLPYSSKLSMSSSPILLNSWHHSEDSRVAALPPAPCATSCAW